MSSETIEAKIHSPTSSIEFSRVLDPLWVVRLLRVGLFLATLTVLGLVLESLWKGAAEEGLALRHEVLTLTVLIIGSSLSLTQRFARNWKVAILALCLLVIASVTWTYIVLGQQVPLFVAALVFLTATCALVPWEFKWQAVLTAGLLLAAGSDTLLVQPANPYIVPLWLGLLASSAMSLAGNWLWAEWRSALAATNRKVEESQSRQRKLLDATMDPLSLVRVSDGRYIDVNKAFVKLGYPPEEVLGKTIKEFDVAELLKPAEFEAKLATRGFAQNQEANIRMADGRIAPHLLSSVLVDLDGELCLLSVARDITQIKEIQNALLGAQDRLKQSEAKLRKIFEASPDVIAIVSLADGHAFDINEACMTMGYTREEFLAWDPNRRMLFADELSRAEFMRKLLTDKIVRNAEAKFRLKDGTIAPYLVSAVIAEFAGEQCMIAFARDITELKRAEEELIATREAALAAREAALAASRAKSDS
jgi:PAS domain S-box-containing protein